MLDSYFAADRQRRSRLEIKIIIMQAILDGNHRLAHIMYYAKIPTRMCTSILKTMEQQGLVSTVVTQIEDTGRKRVKCYDLTDRGKRALDSYLTIINALKLPLENLALVETVIEKKVEASERVPLVEIKAVVPESSSQSISRTSRDN